MQSSSVSRIKQTTQRGFCASLLIAALALGVSGAAQASPLNLMTEKPDIGSFGVSVVYTVGGTNNFTAKGTAGTLNDGVNPVQNFVGIFDLTATIDASGNLLGGSIDIFGTVGGNSSPLLRGTLTDIGFTDDVLGGGPLEFLFDVDAGSLAGIFGGTGGTILSGADFVSWATSFNNVPMTGVADTFTVSPVPVPAAVWLFGSALFGLVGYGRHTKRKQAAA